MLKHKASMLFCLAFVFWQVKWNVWHFVLNEIFEIYHSPPFELSFEHNACKWKKKIFLNLKFLVVFWYFRFSYLSEFEFPNLIFKEKGKMLQKKWRPLGKKPLCKQSWLTMRRTTSTILMSLDFFTSPMASIVKVVL